MTALTTRQRDLLLQLVESDGPVITAALGARLNITQRQVHYGLKNVQRWLLRHDAHLKITPGIGVELICTRAQREQIIATLIGAGRFTLILSVGHRRQLLAFTLLTASAATILADLQDIAQVSRTTILKDLDTVKKWVTEFGLELKRRPNYGIWIEGDELRRRQALAALFWGSIPFEEPLWSMSHMNGLQFGLANDAYLLPSLGEVGELVQQMDTRQKLAAVAAAEADLGVHFSDFAVLYLSLILSIQAFRMESAALNAANDPDISWLQNHPVWIVATKLVTDNLTSFERSLDAEIAYVAKHLLACSKSDPWQEALEIDERFGPLITTLMSQVAAAYELRGMASDAMLRDGFIANVLPACLRERFQLWSPNPRVKESLSPEQYVFEHQIANDLAATIGQEIDVTLPEFEIHNLAMLLRAAYIRTQPHRLHQVYVICPSGMATAQLLVARLKVRFPRLGNLTVISVRNFHTTQLNEADLIITTVPLDTDSLEVPVIQVHPQLLPEDVSKITEWLA